MKKLIFLLLFLCLSASVSAGFTCPSCTEDGSTDSGSTATSGKFYQVCPTFAINNECPVLMQWVQVEEQIDFDSIINVLLNLFEFSVEDFAFFNATCLIGFIVGHSVGRINRLLGKT